MGFHNIVEADGIGIAVTGLIIVFAALTMISLFIAALPHGLKMLEGVLPAETPHAPQRGDERAEEELIAAIAFALHERNRRKPPK